MAKNPSTKIMKSGMEDQSTIRVQGEEFFPLSDKPYFDIILARKNVKPLCKMTIPEKLHSLVPSATIPMLVTYCGKSWEILINKHDDPNSKKSTPGWRAFVQDNHLKVGDACIFELSESSSVKLKFRVQILRGGLPPEFSDKDAGANVSNPIVIE